jgi:hypothetical protein
MKRIDIGSAKLAVVFPEGKLPYIDPDNPAFILNLGGFEIVAKVNAKAARKLASWAGGAVLQGRLIVEGGTRLTLAEAGFSWIDPRPKDGTEAATGGGGE